MEGHKFANIFPMIDGEELENLKKDISEHGLLNSIVLYENKILDGRNRFKACKELNIKPNFEEYKGSKPLDFVISLNLKRRHLTQSQAGVIALDILPMLEEEAKKRQATSTGGNKPQLLAKMPKAEEFHAPKEAGKLFNVGERYVREAKKLKARSPELLEEVRSGRKNFSQIKKEERQEKVEKQIEELKTQPPVQPEGKFDVIVIDPPWKVDFNYGSDHYMGRVANPYPEMTIDEIKKIELPAKDNSILWLWTTHSQIWDAKEIMKHWGFEFKCILVWNKESMGVGKWLRKQCEFCLLGTKGKPVWTATDVRDILTEKRTVHSKKPKAFYEMVDKICYGRKLDYFARNKREGWSVFGDEVK